MIPVETYSVLAQNLLKSAPAPAVRPGPDGLIHPSRVACPTLALAAAAGRTPTTAAPRLASGGRRAVGSGLLVAGLVAVPAGARARGAVAKLDSGPRAPAYPLSALARLTIRRIGRGSALR